MQERNSVKYHWIFQILKLAELAMIACLILLFSFYYYTKSYWKKHFAKVQIEQFINDVQAAEALPERFYEIYDIKNGNTLTSNQSNQLYKGLIQEDVKKPPSAIAAVYPAFRIRPTSFNRLRYKQMEISIAWELEKHLSQKQCHNWYLQKADFLYGNVGICDASSFYFQKDVFELNERELATLVVMLENPRKYNPRRDRSKDISKKKVDQLLERL